MSDKELLGRIHRLVDAEHDLERRHGADGLGADDLAEMRRLEVALDQCWDLLRQRRARRDAGHNPDDATVRPAGVVEGYLQ